MTREWPLRIFGFYKVNQLDVVVGDCNPRIQKAEVEGGDWDTPSTVAVNTPLSSSFCSGCSIKATQ